MKIYFDNAATSPIDPEVVQSMVSVIEGNYGNPSSIHHYGRLAKTVIEKARKEVASHLNASPAEIVFTSGGTEANNMAIRSGTIGSGINHVITSPLEHHSVIHTIEALAKSHNLKVSFVNHDSTGIIDITHLEQLLSENDRSFVSLMHANNEIGNLLNIHHVGEICKKYNAIFHTDTVQTIGHYPINMQELNVHYASCSCHKFHGPKGAGFLYVRAGNTVIPLLHGGSQERNQRGGTENIYGIAGLAKALELAQRDMDKTREHISDLKLYMISRLREIIPGVEFNGDAEGNSLYTVVNARLPETDIAEMLLFNLDIAGIAVSGGSACASGTDVGSHVLKALNTAANRPSCRFSFSKYNTKDEIDVCINQLNELFAVQPGK